MVEIFKTNVMECGQAEMLLQKIHERFGYCQANFDLEDCDRILRIESAILFINTGHIIKLVENYGYRAEVLSD